MNNSYDPMKLNEYYNNIHTGYCDKVCICYNIVSLRNDFNIVGEIVYLPNDNFYIFTSGINTSEVKNYKADLPINNYEQLEADLGRVSLKLKKSVLNEVVK